MKKKLSARDYFATITIEEADMICREAMVPGGPCNTFKELANDPQVKDREMLIHVEDPKVGDTLQVGFAAKFIGGSDGESHMVAPAPALGADTESYLKELGISGEKMEHMRSEGII